MPIAKSVYVAGFAGGAVLIAAMIGIATIQMSEIGPPTAANTGTESKGARPTNIQTDENPSVVSPSSGRPIDRPVASTAPQASSPAPVPDAQQEPGARAAGSF